MPANPLTVSQVAAQLQLSPAIDATPDPDPIPAPGVDLANGRRGAQIPHNPSPRPVWTLHPYKTP